MEGVDHIGHCKKTVWDPEIDSHLKQNSEFLEKLIAEMNNDTMVLVTGDHGMREDGHHGGSSIDETETMLLGVWKGQKLSQKRSQRSLGHKDVTPTLAILLGVPLPSNAIGYPILSGLPVGLVESEQWREVQKKLLDHMLRIREFYGMPVVQQEVDRYLSAVEKGDH